MRFKPDTFALTVVLALLTALGPLSTDMYLPALPALGRHFEVTAADVQLTLSVFLFGFAVGQIGYGPIADRFGRKPVLLAGLGLFILSTLMCMAATSIAMLVVARFVQALGASGPIVLARAVVRDLYEGARAGRELSRMGTIMGFVPAIAPTLGGVLLQLTEWRAIFAVQAILAVVLGIFVVLGLPETLRSASAAPVSLIAILRGFGALLGHGVFRVYVGLAALTYAGLFAFISGSPFVLQGIYGLSEIAFALAFALVVIGYMCGTLLAPRALSQRGLDGAIAIGVACMAAGGGAMLALVLAGAGPWLAVVAPMMVFGLGVGFAFPQAIAGAMGPFPHRAGAASSLLGICQMTFAALVGIGLGHALGPSPLPMPLVIAAAGLLALALFWLTPRIRGG
jgi:DHA1 family bicyclomycin/chloramphenicol resistance-like MFS transporter